MCGVCEGLQAGAGSSGVTVALKEAQRASWSKDHSPPPGPLPGPRSECPPSQAELSPAPPMPRPLLPALGLSSVLFLLS